MNPPKNHAKTLAEWDFLPAETSGIPNPGEIVLRSPPKEARGHLDFSGLPKRKEISSLFFLSSKPSIYGDPPIIVII